MRSTLLASALVAALTGTAAANEYASWLEQTELRLGLLCEVLVSSGATQGPANGQACATDLRAGTVSVRAALRR